MATPQGTQNRPQNIPGGLGGTPILAPKEVLLRNGPRGRNFRRFWLPKCQFWLPKRQFWKRFRIIFHMSLGSPLAAALQIARHNVSCNIVSCKTKEEEEQQQQQQQQQLACKRWYVLQHLVLQIAAAALANRSSSSSSGSIGTSRQ